MSAAVELVTAYIIKKWNLDVNQGMPVRVPNSSRIDLAKLFKELDYRKGAEIGTARGSNARTLKTNNPECELYCIDAWELYDGMHDFTDQSQLNEFYAAAQHRLKKYDGVHFIKAFSMEGLKHFDDNSLDFVYIDANHELPYVTEDIFYWSKKVKSGGIVSGHDYLDTKRPDGLVHVNEAVHAYTDAFSIKPWFVVDECSQKRAGSFFWVKP